MPGTQYMWDPHLTLSLPPLSHRLTRSISLSLSHRLTNCLSPPRRVPCWTSRSSSSSPASLRYFTSMSTMCTVLDPSSSLVSPRSSTTVHHAAEVRCTSLVPHVPLFFLAKVQRCSCCHRLRCTSKSGAHDGVHHRRRCCCAPLQCISSNVQFENNALHLSLHPVYNMSTKFTIQMFAKYFFSVVNCVFVHGMIP